MKKLLAGVWALFCGAAAFLLIIGPMIPQITARAGSMGIDQVRYVATILTICALCAIVGGHLIVSALTEQSDRG